MMSAMAETRTGRAFARLAFSDSVKATQARYGVRERTGMLETEAAPNDVLTDVPRAFLETCDSFVIASAGRNLWPHVQHRGGPRGFLRCLDDRTLAFGDFDGNRQFLTLGNVAENPRVMLLLIDRRTRRRLKIWAEAEVIYDDAKLLARLDNPAYPARPKRAVVLHVLAWDINCPQHIPRLYTEEEVREAISALQPG